MNAYSRKKADELFRKDFWNKKDNAPEFPTQLEVINHYITCQNLNTAYQLGIITGEQRIAELIKLYGEKQ